MEKLSTIIVSIMAALLALAVQSCSNSQQRVIDSDTVVIEVEEKSPVMEHHEEEGKVIADLKFFISEKDYNKNRCKYLASIDGENGYLIGDYNAGYSPLARFENDSLYYIEFGGFPIDIEDFDGELKNQYMTLLHLYASKYGDPTYQRDFFPKSYDTKSGYYYELSRWDLGKRSISIRLSESYSGRYNIELVIYRNDISKRIRERRQKEADNRQASAASVI